MELLGLLAQYSSSSDGGSAAVGWLIFIGIAVIFGAWSANAAERKGIPRSTGWLLGIFLGLLGRIIVGVMRDRTIHPVPTAYVPPAPPLR